VLATLAGDQRRRLHRQAARALHAAGLPAERVAEHLLLGGAGAGPWSTDVLRSAAGAALDRGSAARAARYLRRALLDAPDDGPCRAGLLVDLAVAERGADPVFAAQQLATAIPFLPPGPERAVAALCVPPTVSARQPGLRRLIRQAAADLAELDPDGAHRELAVRLEARIRWLALQDPGSLGTAAPRLAELGADRLAGTGAGRELLAVLSCAAALGATRPAAEIAGCVELVLLGEPADPAHTMTTLPVLTQTAVAVDSVAALEPWLDRAAAVARSGEPPGVQAAIAAELSLLYAGTGRLAQARQYAAEALAGAGPGWPETAVLATTALSVVALQTQDLDLAAEIIPTLRSTDDVRMIVGDRMLRGMVAAVSGDLPAALDGFLDAGWHLARCGWIGPGGPPWRLWAAAVHRRLGEPEAARQLAETEHRMAEAWGGPTARGRALRLRGALTPGDAGVELLREGVDVLRASVDKLELARTTVALGRRLGAGGRPGADSLLAEGERLARECGASWLEASRTSEYHGPVPRLLRSGRDRLTRAEDAVVALVLRGWTNARIAEELAVTKRAVEKNLTGVYRKLGVAGRAALVRELGAAAPGESR
jgi:DNA-binding CsgD family transcriptional regulator